MTSNSADPDHTRWVWIATALVLIAAWLHSGFSPWLMWLIRLLAVYVLALESARQPSDGYGLRGRVTVSLVCALIASVIIDFAIRLIGAKTDITADTFGFFVNVTISAVFAGYFLLSTILQNEAKSRELIERQAIELKLHALQAQIEPHFLYNTLANVGELVRTSPSDAEKMLANLVRYLKSAIPDIRGANTTLTHEVERAAAYLAIMQIRMGTRLQYAINVEDSLGEIKLPPLSLLTLVENAVQHGLDRLPDGGRIVITGSRLGKLLVLKVGDDGAGFNDDIGSGVGLANLRDRLEALYGSRARLQLTRADPRGVDAILEVPID